MSVRITESTGPYALYDSVTGIAFGETFDSHADAEDFLRDMNTLDPRFDPRTLEPIALSRLRREWEDLRDA